VKTTVACESASAKARVPMKCGGLLTRQRGEAAMSTEVDQDARKFVKALYKATEGRPMQWQMVVGDGGN
jgi:hypothetical protein